MRKSNSNEIKISKKTLKIYIFLGIIIILIVFGFYLEHTRKLTGNVTKDNLVNPSADYQPSQMVFVDSKDKTSADKQQLNDAIDFLRSCLLNCPKECSSCGVLSLKCVETCENIAESKVDNKVSSDEEIYSLLTNENLKWYACADSCTDFSDKSYVDYDCIRRC